MDIRIRQAPGWWASLCEATCNECGWVGPTRDVTNWQGEQAIKRDEREHMCGDAASNAGAIVKQTEPSLWTVGWYSRRGQWEPDSDHGSPQEAAARAAELNG